MHITTIINFLDPNWILYYNILFTLPHSKILFLYRPWNFRFLSWI